MVLQIVYQRYVSRKKSVRSMMYITVSVKMAWFLQRKVPRMASAHP